MYSSLDSDAKFSKAANLHWSNPLVSSFFSFLSLAGVHAQYILAIHAAYVGVYSYLWSSLAVYKHLDQGDP